MITCQDHAPLIERKVHKWRLSAVVLVIAIVCAWRRSANWKLFVSGSVKYSNSITKFNITNINLVTQNIKITLVSHLFMFLSVVVNFLFVTNPLIQESSSHRILQGIPPPIITHYQSIRVTFFRQYIRCFSVQTLALIITNLQFDILEFFWNSPQSCANKRFLIYQIIDCLNRLGQMLAYFNFVNSIIFMTLIILHKVKVV